MTPDTRPLSQRVRAIGRRFAAQADGYRKRSEMLRQDADNAQRDAATLDEAADALERRQ